MDCSSFKGVVRPKGLDGGRNDNDLRARRWLSPAGSRQRSSVSAGCHTRPAAEYRCQMALVAKPDLLSDIGEGLIAPADQSFARSRRRCMT
jgi:hypothetical protein